MSEKKTALLAIDLQFGPLYGTYKREETFSIIKKMILKAEEENSPIFYVQHEDLPGGGHLERGTPFWQFVEGISPRVSDYIISKTSTDAFHETTLKEDLEAVGVSHLIIVGARTEYCIDTTCRRAVTLGFEVTLVENGHTTADGAIPADMIIKHHNHNLSTVKTIQNRISVTPSDKVRFF